MMGGRKGAGRARRADGSGQSLLPLSLGEPVEPREVSSEVKFVNPSPHHIAAGGLPLGDFLHHNGFGWVVAMRDILQSLDWTSYAQRYTGRGRHPYHPALVVGLILLGHMLGHASLRQLETLARTDLRAWWITGGIMPDYSSLSRFINRHILDLTEATFEALTASILHKLNSKANVLAIDGTVVQAAASRYRLLKLEAATDAANQASQAAKDAPQDARLQAKAELAKEVLDTVEARDAARQAQGRKGKDGEPGFGACVSPTEPEAAHQPLKQGGYACSYKPSAGVNADRIIVGKQVEASNESIQVESIVQQVKRVTGQAPTTVLADAGYHNETVMAVADEHGIELLCPAGKTGHDGSIQKKSSQSVPKKDFTFDPIKDLYICPQGRQLTRDRRDNTRSYTRYRSVDCSNCPLAGECLQKEGTRRTLKRYDHEQQKEEVKERLRDPEVKKLYAKRGAWVEPVHGEQKHHQGMQRFRRRGLKKVRLEYSLHCMAHNLRRFKALRAKGRASRFFLALHAPHWRSLAHRQVTSHRQRRQLR